MHARTLLVVLDHDCRLSCDHERTAARNLGYEVEVCTLLEARFQKKAMIDKNRFYSHKVIDEIFSIPNDYSGRDC